jgi:hypothetical protein
VDGHVALKKNDRWWSTTPPWPAFKFSVLCIFVVIRFILAFIPTCFSDLLYQIYSKSKAGKMSI